MTAAPGPLQGAVENIQSFGSGWDPDDAEDIHATVSNLHQVEAALQEAYEAIAGRLEETGIHPDRAEALHEHSARLGSLAEDLEERIGGGVVRR